MDHRENAEDAQLGPFQCKHHTDGGMEFTAAKGGRADIAANITISDNPPLLILLDQCPSTGIEVVCLLLGDMVGVNPSRVGVEQELDEELETEIDARQLDGDLHPIICLFSRHFEGLLDEIRGNVIGSNESAIRNDIEYEHDECKQDTDHPQAVVQIDVAATGEAAH